MSTSKASEAELRRIDLFRSENPDSSCLEEVKQYLMGLLPSVSVRILPSVFSRVERSTEDEMSTKLARARMKNPDAAEQAFEPMYGEIEYERRAIAGKARVGGVVYDGRKMGSILLPLLEPENSLETASIVFTDRLVSTYSHDDLRHHLRTAVFGFPCIISLPGIVEAPAKSREYHVLRQRLEIEGAGDLAVAKLRNALKDEFIDYDDPRAVEALKGLTLQAVIFHLTLEPFCEDKDCRLFNAHWQADLIRSQISSGELCRKHADMLTALSKKPLLRW
jgi:hypothetical protein